MSNLHTNPNGFPGITALHEFHVPTCSEGAPLPEVPKPAPRPLVTYRVVIRDTGAALRRFHDQEPSFGKPALYASQLCEFTTHDAAEWALWFVQNRTEFNRGVALEVRAEVHAGITPAQENALFCSVRDTAQFQAFADWRLTESRHRGLAGLRPLSANGSRS